MRHHPIPARTRRSIAAGIATVVSVGALVAAAPAAAAINGCSLTQSRLDLNGDGYDDAVVGDPYATVSGRKEAGAIVVLYGDADRRIGEGRRVLMTQNSVFGSNAEAGDHFGWSVAVADATGDGCADILVGSPGENWAGDADAGVAHLISFIPDGTGGAGGATSELLDQGDVGGSIEAGDQFGYAVALADHGGGTADSIGAVGAPGEDLRGVVDAGVVNTFNYLDDAQSGVQQREQGAGLPGVPQNGDRFGAAVMIAPLWVTSGADVGIEPSIVAGSPGDAVPRAGARSVDNAGSVTAWDQITGYRELIHQETAGVAGSAESGDQFGYSLAFSEPSASPTGPRDVAVGVPGENLGSVVDAGAVNLFADVPRAGLEGRQALSQASPGVAGTVEAHDRFGHSVALRPDGGSTATLVVGAPYEDIGSVSNAGMATTVVLTSTTRQLTPGRALTENSTGTPGTVAKDNRFALTVAAVAGVAESVFTISSPYQGAGSVFLVSQDGSTRSWVPGRGGVPASTSGRFGWSVAGLQG